MLKENQLKQIELKNIGLCSLKHWTPESALKIHKNLEIHNWAPWLAASPESLIGRACVFPKGQLLMESPNGEILASVSANRIQWDGYISSLPNWDTVAGDPTTYEKTFVPDGNTLVLMSMNVHPKYKKYGLATALIHQIQEVAAELGVNNLIGSFRPSEFGKYKSEHGETLFEDYVFQTRVDDSLPVDAWIRSLTRSGMLPLAIDKHAMTVPIDLNSFADLKASYHPNLWDEVSTDVWECGEVGQWKVDMREQKATYQESNLWGIIPGTEGYKKFEK